jgi:hypothetical protein
MTLFVENKPTLVCFKNNLPFNWSIPRADVLSY